MNFQKIIPVERSKNCLDQAFRKAREKSDKPLKGDWLEKIKKKELIKLDTIKSQLTSKLESVIESFPRLEELPSFYQELLKLTLDCDNLKKSLGGLNWATRRIKFLHKDYVGRIVKSYQAGKIRQSSREFYGRISSTLKQLDPQLFFLEACRQIFRKYPDVKEAFTVVIFGFPNVGKTTLLNKITTAKGKVAEYAFTTQGINSGFTEIKGQKIQVLDVPGTLARIDKMNDIEKIAYLTARKLANLIIFVFDLSRQSAYPLKPQEQLFQAIKKEKKVLVYLSKEDITEKKIAEEFKKRYESLGLEELKEEIERLV